MDAPQFDERHELRGSTPSRLSALAGSYTPQPSGDHRSKSSLSEEFLNQVSSRPSFYRDRPRGPGATGGRRRGGGARPVMGSVPSCEPG